MTARSCAERPLRLTRVVAAADAYAVREFLTTVLNDTPGLDLAAICSNGNELREAVAAHHPDVVVTDVRMPPAGEHEGIRVAMSLRETHPTVGVVVLSQSAEPTGVLALFDGGTGRRAYLLKDRIRSKSDLIEAIEKVAAGGSAIDPLVVDVLIQARARAASSQLTSLTAREREVLSEVATGKSNGAIAESLFLTKRAVEKHVNSIFSKLNLTHADTISRRVKATLIFLSESAETRTRLQSAR